MAYSGNQQLPGLHPVKSGVAGTAPMIRHIDVSATYATTIAEGCILVKDALGANMAAAAGTCNATRASVIGVAAHNVAATPGADTKVAVYIDPQQEFVAPQDGTMTSTVAKEAIGQFIGCVSNVYSATLGQGKLLLDTSSLTSVLTNTVYLQVTGIEPPVGETLSNTYGQLRVKFADAIHTFASNAVTRITA